MRLVSIELGGFKSFAKPTTVTVDPGLTAIVGPNGSGKSNLAEAVKWVLGEQSFKQLRGQSRADILFAGTDTTKAAGRAYVRLTFENEDGRLPVDAAEVAVARTLSSGGDSDYTVNGESVRLVDLRRMLAEAGIGPRTYTVISQGMVDRYLTTSAAERKTFFDEASGTLPLQIRLREVQRRLTSTNGHLGELRAVLNELIPRLRLLAREMRKQEERQRLEAAYSTVQAAWFHQEWGTRQQELEHLRGQVDGLEQAVAAARRQREAAETYLMSQAERREASIPAFSWNSRVHKTLKECLALVEALLHTHSVSHDFLLALRRELGQLLSPSPTSPAAAENSLPTAREAELAAERGLAAARVGLEQAEGAAALLRQAVVRERGSVFLKHIETTAPPPGARVEERDIRRVAEQLARLGEADPLALREYEETQRRASALEEQIRDSEETVDRLQAAAAKLELAVRERFARQFAVLQQSFGHYFTRLFGGGEARLVQASEGIEIMATPPGKRPRHVGLLSGGERTLASLALLLAIVDAQLPPFVVLDEVDAALDEANSQRFAELLKETSRRIQCLTITHNRETMGQADILYGVTMQQAGISTLYSVKFDDLG